MKTDFVTPRVFAHFFLENEERVNIDATLLMVMPDGTPAYVQWVDVDKSGTIVLQAKPEEK